MAVQAAAVVPRFQYRPADDHGAGAAGEDRPGDGEEQEDLLVLLVEQAEAEDEHRHAEDRPPQDPEVLPRRERLLAERHDHVLDEDAPPGVQVRVVRAR